MNLSTDFGWNPIDLHIYCQVMALGSSAARIFGDWFLVDKLGKDQKKGHNLTVVH